MLFYELAVIKGGVVTIKSVYKADKEGTNSFWKDMKFYIARGYKVTSEMKAVDEFTEEEKNTYTALKDVK